MRPINGPDDCPRPPADQTIEAACRCILGQMESQLRKPSFQLNPGQLVLAAWMLDAGWDLNLVEAAVFVLLRWAWFVQTGYAGQPWEVTGEDWARLMDASPWGSPERQLLLEGL